MDDATKLAITSIIRQYGLAFLFGLLGTFFILVGIFQSVGEPEEEIVFAEEEEVEAVVDVRGAVINPGVYSIESQSRLQDAVIAAGGLHVDADREYLSKNVNMARVVEDGEKVYISFKGENEEEVMGVDDIEMIVGDVDEGVLNLNSASDSELDDLPGVGPVTVEKIVAGRPYGSVGELLERDVVGEAQFEKIKDLVTIN